MTNTARLEALVWVLIYGGLLLAALGFFVARADGPEGNVLGGTLMTGGGIAAAAGVVLIWVRSRLGRPRGD